MVRRLRRAKQLSLDLTVRTHGGVRANAGRKKQREGVGRLPHTKRRVFHDRCPVHVVLRVVAGLASLRDERTYLAVHRAFKAAADGRRDLRLVHFSVQGNHMHLLVEADDARAFVRGLQGLEVRIARRVNRALGRRGRVFADRYFGRPLKTPTEVHFALGYVLLNRGHHTADRARTRVRQAAAPRRSLDAHSSAPFFTGFAGRPLAAMFLAAGPPEAPPIFAPETWLLKTGWKRVGPIDPTRYR